MVGITLCLLLGLFMGAKQISARPTHIVPAAGSRADRSSYYIIDCPGESSPARRRVTPLPDSRYLYSDSYGWFDTAHFGTGHPDQLIADLESAAAGGGGIIAVSQQVRDGLTGYTAYYLISGDVAEKDVVGTALGIYMDWSVRFEAWQGQIPRSLVGPLTPFSIEDLPSQYLSFFEDATSLDMAAIFTCYIGDVTKAEAPPHIWVDAEAPQPGEGSDLPHIERLINKGFQPMLPTDEGWQVVRWPVALRLVPLSSSHKTWLLKVMRHGTWVREMGPGNEQ
ncbi:MAG: hypothetical protein HC804_04505 [Anaerolineae bacterium]|nr:hypothetical protein [Anaerolineae bacterium]